MAPVGGGVGSRVGRLFQHPKEVPDGEVTKRQGVAKVETSRAVTIEVRKDFVGRTLKLRLQNYLRAGTRIV